MRGVRTINDDEKKEAERSKKPAGPTRTPPPGSNVDACAMFFGGLAGLQKRNIGDRPHICMLSPYRPPPFFFENMQVHLMTETS